MLNMYIIYYEMFYYSTHCILYALSITCKPCYSNNGTDYTQSKQRKKYAEQCFGKDPPILEKLVIKGPEESIKHDSIASKLPTNNIRMK